jgi:CBS domain-containing protein
MWLMTEQRIRHLPVLDGPKLVGMISIGDLVKTRLDDVTREKEHLIRYVTDQYPG